MFGQHLALAPGVQSEGHDAPLERLVRLFLGGQIGMDVLGKQFFLRLEVHLSIVRQPRQDLGDGLAANRLRSLAAGEKQSDHADDLLMLLVEQPDSDAERLVPDDSFQARAFSVLSSWTQ